MFLSLIQPRIDTCNVLLWFLCVQGKKPENESVQGALRDSAPREELCHGSAGDAGGKNGSEEGVHRLGYVNGSVTKDRKKMLNCYK